MFVNNLIDSTKGQMVAIVNGSKAGDSDVIRRYTYSMYHNFSGWMSAAAVLAQHDEARQIAKENFECELFEHHPEMLRRFAVAVGCWPNDQTHHFMLDRVLAVTGSISDNEVVRLPGLAAISVCALLENTSSVFIPDLAKRAINLGSVDLEYTDKHGEADLEHAREFARALDLEAGKPEKDSLEGCCNYVATRVIELFEGIYH